MFRVLFVAVAVMMLGAAVGGCRAEIEADDFTNVTAPR